MINTDIAKGEFTEITTRFITLFPENRTLEEMCCQFGGRLDPVCRLFDFDYKHLTATIFEQNGTLALSHSVEVWEDNGWDYRTEEL